MKTVRLSASLTVVLNAVLTLVFMYAMWVLNATGYFPLTPGNG